MQEAKSLQPPLVSSTHLKGGANSIYRLQQHFRAEEQKEDWLPVNGLTEGAVSLVTRAAGAVDGRSRLVAVGVLVAAAVVLGAEVWSCRGREFRCLRQRVGFSLVWVKLAVVRSPPPIDRVGRRNTHAALGCRRSRCPGSRADTDTQGRAHTRPEGNTGDTPVGRILEGTGQDSFIQPDWERRLGR